MHLEQYELEGEAFLRRIITTNETWAKAYEPKLKRQPNGVIAGHHKKERPTLTNMKTMLVVAYGFNGVIVIFTTLLILQT